jgi:hypothetical protein
MLGIVTASYRRLRVDRDRREAKYMRDATGGGWNATETMGRGTSRRVDSREVLLGEEGSRCVPDWDLAGAVLATTCGVAASQRSP